MWGTDVCVYHMHAWMHGFLDWTSFDLAKLIFTADQAYLRCNEEINMAFSVGNMTVQ